MKIRILLTGALLFALTACHKSDTVTVYPLSGDWIFRSQAGTVQVSQDLGGIQAFSSSRTDASVEITFGDDGRFAFVNQGVLSNGTYTQTDTLLTLSPDSSAFADFCFADPEITFITTPPGQIPVTPPPPPLFHTPGKLTITVLTADSLQLNTNWNVPGTNGAPDTLRKTMTGFRRV